MQRPPGVPTWVFPCPRCSSDGLVLEAAEAIRPRGEGGVLSTTHLVNVWWVSEKSFFDFDPTSCIRTFLKIQRYTADFFLKKNSSKTLRHSEVVEPVNTESFSGRSGAAMV